MVCLDLLVDLMLFSALSLDVSFVQYLEAVVGFLNFHSKHDDLSQPGLVTKEMDFTVSVDSLKSLSV